MASSGNSTRDKTNAALSVSLAPASASRMIRFAARLVSRFTTMAVLILPVSACQRLKSSRSVGVDGCRQCVQRLDALWRLRISSSLSLHASLQVAVWRRSLPSGIRSPQIVQNSLSVSLVGLDCDFCLWAIFSVLGFVEYLDGEFFHVGIGEFLPFPVAEHSSLRAAIERQFLIVIYVAFLPWPWREVDCHPKFPSVTHDKLAP